MFYQTVDIERIDDIISLYGDFDMNIKRLENEFSVMVEQAEGELRVNGEPENVEKGVRAVKCLLALLKKGDKITEQSLDYTFTLIRDNKDEEYVRFLDNDCICVTSHGKPVKAKTLGQKTYVDAIKDNTITVGIGPAGTGKTYLAVALAVKAFRAKEINKIILTRPAVEAGERLGFLPGDLQQKVDPYLRPLYDALFEMMGDKNFLRAQERGDIEVVPLAYMRGRTLNDSFIILDEAQNTTREQMKMFLTRLGFNSKAVVTGDITQTDLPTGKSSGLNDCIKILKDIEGIEVIRLSAKDVVRHRLVQKIIDAYEKYDMEREK